MSYDLVIAAAEAPDWHELARAIDLPDLRGLPGGEPGQAVPGALHLHREGLSTRTTEVRWDADDKQLRIAIRALASAEDADLALRVAEAAARHTGAPTVEADYFGAVALTDLRRLHNGDWMSEQAASGTGALATLIREGRGPMEVPGPRRSCFIGTRLLADLESAGPADTLPGRVIATVRRVQWGVPPGFRDAGVFASGGRDGARETRFAVWLPGEDLVIPRVDFVALRIIEGEVLVVPAAAVPALAGAHAEPLDEVQLLIRAMSETDWRDLVERARPLARAPAK